MNFIVRPGEKKDAQAILDLIVELAVFEKEPNAVEVTLYDLIKDGFSEQPKFKTFVAEETDGTIIGMSLFYERYSTWKGVSIHLEDLMITKSKRGVGAGKKLYAAVLKYAHAIGCKRVSWEVLEWNKNAVHFYESTGATILEDWQVVHMNQENLQKFVEHN
jgi:GNAT superfamily N-acetyltransferase